MVWEETIIGLPPTCRVVCLSATVPNHLECALWIGATKRRVVYVVSTSSRPTPLRHFLYAAQSLFLVVGEEGTFRSEAHAEATRALELARKQSPQPGRSGARGAEAASNASSAYWSQLLSTLLSMDLLPSVVFSFSKAKCDELALGISSGAAADGMTLCKPHEAAQAKAFYDACLARLSPEERSLPQLKRVLALLLTGGVRMRRTAEALAHTATARAHTTGPVQAISRSLSLCLRAARDEKTTKRCPSPGPNTVGGVTNRFEFARQSEAKAHSPLRTREASQLDMTPPPPSPDLAKLCHGCPLATAPQTQTA